MLEQFDQFRTTRLDPKIHGIHRDELRPLDLLEHLQLQPRIDVGQEDERRTPKLLGDFRREVREDAEMRFQRFRRIQIVSITPAPPETRPGRALDASEIDAALGEDGQLVDRIVVADYADELHRREVRRG